jgi:hypothetical protein
VVAGLLAGLAMQTKYTALLIPPAIGWYGLTHRRIWLGIASASIAVVVFAGWEVLLLEKYGRSHFVYHASEQKAVPKPGESQFAAFAREKTSLVPPLTGHLGCLGIGVSLVAWSAIGLPRRNLAIAAGVWAGGFALIALVPYWQAKLPGVANPLTRMMWAASGWIVLIGVAGCAAVLCVRTKRGWRIHGNADSLFLSGWVLLELAGYFALTPFGAARRVIGLVVVGGLLAARVLGYAERLRPEHRLPEWVVPFGVIVGFFVAAVDTFDAFPEKWCAEKAATVAADRPPDSTVWFVGHWGFQYYCEREGMKPLVPGQSVLLPGNVLVLPIPPDTKGFHRPHTGSDPLHVPDWAAVPLVDITWDDALPAMTVPNYYGGVDPVVGHIQPRLHIRVYRIRERWLVPGE